MKTLLKRLLETHRALDRQVSRELAHRMPDQHRLARLKKQRLLVKDRLSFLQAQAAQAGTAARSILARHRVLNT